MKIEVVVADDVAEKTVEPIAGAARTGQIGDGRIFVCDVGSADPDRRSRRRGAATPAHQGS